MFFYEQLITINYKICKLQIILNSIWESRFNFTNFFMGGRELQVISP